MFLIAAAVLFGVFALNVGMGSASNNAFMGDVNEMLCLFAATICFVVAILKSEAKARKKTDTKKS